MQYLRIIAVFTLLLVGMGHVEACADGGQVRIMQQQGDYQLTVFTSPNPLRAGPADFSVLLQDTRTHQAIPDATITIELTPPDNSRPPIRAIATAGAATNKLLRAALVDLPAAGQWHVRVECATPQTPVPITAAFDMVAAPPLPRWLTVWPWFTWPGAAVLLFAFHRMLVAQKNSRHAAGGTPGASSDRRGEFEPAPPRPSPSLRDVPPNPALHILSHRPS